MLKNNNKKIVHKIAFRSLKAGKMRDIFVIITIAMTSALISGLAGFSVGNEKEEERALSAMQHVIYTNVTEEQIENLQNDERIEETVVYKRGSSFETDGCILSPAYFQNNTGRMKTFATAISKGHYPDKRNEIAVDKAYMEYIGKEAEIGEEITITWLDGTAEDYVVSGYTDYQTSSKSFTLLFSEEYARNGSQLKNIPCSVAARIYEAEDMSRDEFLSEIRSIGEQYGIERYDVKENARFVNNKSGTSAEMFTVAGVSAAILLVSILVIYSIFYIGVTGRIREFGQLRTIGMTSGQIRKTVNMEGVVLTFAGLIAGLLIGTAFAYVLKPAGFYFPNTLVIWLVTAVSVFLMVLFSIRKPAKTAACVSPVEAAKVSGYEVDGRMAKRRRLTPFGLAGISVERNRKKFRMTVLSLGIAGVLFLCGTTLLSSYNMEENARQLDFYFGEYLIRISSNAAQLAEHGMADMQMNNPLDEELKARIDSIDGVKNITVIESMELTYEYQNYRADDCAAPFSREETELLNRHREEGEIFDYDKMVRDKEIIINDNEVAEEIFGWRFQTGDQVLLRWFDGTEYREDSFRIAGCIDTMGLYMDTDDSGRRLEGGLGWFLIPRDLIENMVPESYNLSSKFIVSVKDWQNDTEVENQLETIAAEDSALTLRTLTEDMEESRSVYASLQYMIYGLSAFLMGFALINLINTLVSNAMSRRREFAMLRSIGMGAGQLSRMMIGEGLMLAARNLILTAVLGTAAGYVLIIVMRNFGATYLHWHFPMGYLLGYAVLVIVSPVIISEAVIKIFDKKALVEQLRESE
ncbi:MAG: FtsX-like permease family protein [Ruminococcus sp.]|nr:FtsX-like permease family protein [Ruminococcus sp.]